MKRRHLATALLALSCSLTFLPACGRGKGSATPQAAQELAELRAEQELGFAGDADSALQAEIADLLARFEKTADATLASTPHRITLLHLACVYKKAELARCLLLDGADPNARQLTELPWEGGNVGAEPDATALVPGDTPLTWATIPQREGATAEEMLPLINLLVEKGADVNLPGPLGLPPLVTATLNPSPAGEAVFLRLLEQGARCSQFAPEHGGNGTSIPLSALVAANGWNQALEKLLDTGAVLATPARSALHGAAERPAQAGAMDCAKILLARGAEVDALNDEGATALYIATHGLAEPGGNEPATVAAIGDMAALLLQHGADPLRCCDADPEFPASCAADFIAMSPVAQAALAARGITVPRRPIHFEAEGAALLTEICRASLFSTPAQEIAPHYAKLATLLTMPPHELEHFPLYPDAFGHAVKLLSRVAGNAESKEEASVGQLVAELPLWKEQEAWESGDARTASLMEAILSTPQLVLPREQLLEHARRMDGWGVSEVAALLVELLERDTDAEADIATLCTDASPAMRAGALTARLLRAGLPAPRNGAVAEWMAERGIEEEHAPASLRRALLLTSLDKFWYGNMAAEEVRALLEAMRSIGAPQAATFYAELAANLDKPEELDRLTAPGGAADTARFELECATALFIWSQREEWLRLGSSPAPQAAPQEGANEPRS